MNWEALGAIGELAGALVVVLTLFYLAVQIKQNTLAVKTSSHHAITDSFNVINGLMASDPRLARIWRLGTLDMSALSEDEQISFSFMNVMVMRVYETLYYQHQAGTIEDQLYLGEENTIKWAIANPGFREWWLANPISFGPEFRDYIAKLIEDIDREDS
jgi:hypothetical protein